MLRYLLILFLALPFVDLYLLMQLTGWIGFPRTLVVVLATGVVGAEIIRREGRTVLSKAGASVTAEEISRNVLEIVLLVLGGVMLLSPGLVTDFLGLLMVVRPTRERLMLRISDKLGSNSNVHVETYQL